MTLSGARAAGITDVVSVRVHAIHMKAAGVLWKLSDAVSAMMLYECSGSLLTSTGGRALVPRHLRILRFGRAHGHDSTVGSSGNRVKAVELMGGRQIRCGSGGSLSGEFRSGVMELSGGGFPLSANGGTAVAAARQLREPLEFGSVGEAGKISLPSPQEMMNSVQDFYAKLEASGKPKRLAHNLATNQHDCDNWLAEQTGSAPVEAWRIKIYEATSRNKRQNPETYRDVWPDEELHKEANDCLEKIDFSARSPMKSSLCSYCGLILLLIIRSYSHAVGSLHKHDNLHRHWYI